MGVKNVLILTIFLIILILEKKPPNQLDLLTFYSIPSEIVNRGTQYECKPDPRIICCLKTSCS